MVFDTALEFQSDVKNVSQKSAKELALGVFVRIKFSFIK